MLKAEAVVAILADIDHNDALRRMYAQVFTRTAAKPAMTVYMGAVEYVTSHWTVVSATSVLPHMQLV